MPTADNKLRTSDTEEYTQECSLCKEQINDGCSAINCLYCNYRTHMICIIKKFESVNSSQLRSAAEWMKEFFSYSHFAYVCESCHTTSTATSANANKYGDSPSLPMQVHNLNVIVTDIHSKLEGFNTNIQSLLVAKKQTTVNQINDTSEDAFNTNRPTSKLLSYANVTEGDLANVVKSAVRDNIRTQSLDEKVGGAIVIYGLAESKNYLSKVYALLQCNKRDDYFVRVERIGKPITAPNSNMKPENRKIRPLKVELKSQPNHD